MQRGEGCATSPSCPLSRRRLRAGRPLGPRGPAVQCARRAAAGDSGRAREWPRDRVRALLRRSAAWRRPDRARPSGTRARLAQRPRAPRVAHRIEQSSAGQRGPAAGARAARAPRIGMRLAARSRRQVGRNAARFGRPGLVPRETLAAAAPAFHERGASSALHASPSAGDSQGGKPLSACEFDFAAVQREHLALLLLREATNVRARPLAASSAACGQWRSTCRASRGASDPGTRPPGDRARPAVPARCARAARAAGIRAWRGRVQ